MSLNQIVTSPILMTVFGVALGALLTQFLDVLGNRPIIKTGWIIWFGATTFLLAVTCKHDAGAEQSEKSGDKSNTDVGSLLDPVFIEHPEFDGLIVRQKSVSTLDSRVDQIEFDVRDKNGVVATGIAINIDNECSWDWASSSELVNRSGERCNFADRYKNPVFFDRLQRSFNIVFVGMDSYPGRTNRNSNKLTHDRALTLAHEAVPAFPDLQSGSKRGWIAAIGRSTAKVRKGSADELRQRAAVIIGITTDRDWPYTQRIIRASLNRLEVGGVSFSEYDQVSNFDPSEIDLSVLQRRD